jgi:hypothetical protein
MRMHTLINPIWQLARRHYNGDMLALRRELSIPVSPSSTSTSPSCSSAGEKSASAAGAAVPQLTKNVSAEELTPHSPQRPHELTSSSLQTNNGAVSVQPTAGGYIPSWECALSAPLSTRAIDRASPPPGSHIHAASELDALHLAHLRLRGEAGVEALPMQQLACPRRMRRAQPAPFESPPSKRAS